MSTDMDSSSFEVIEDEVLEDQFDHPSDEVNIAESLLSQPVESCFTIEPSNQENAPATNAEPSDNEWTTDFSSEENASIALQDQDNEREYRTGKQSQPDKFQTIKTAAPNGSLSYPSLSDFITSHSKCVTLITALFAVTLALIWTNIRYAFQISHLQAELTKNDLKNAQALLSLSTTDGDHQSILKNVLIELEHERRLLNELREQYESRGNRDAQSDHRLLELQQELETLRNELRVQSERHTAHQLENANMILDLQSERHRLMHEVDELKHRRGSECTTNPHDSLIKKLRKLKNALMKITGACNSLLGGDYVQQLLCQIPHLCDEE